MDKQAVYQQLKGHEWIVKANGTSRVTMGHNGGILAIEFLADGQISSESQMEFWPNIKRWDFDELQQQIQFIDADDQIIQRFTIPQMIGNQMILQEVGGRDQYTYNLTTDVYRNLLVAPMTTKIQLGPSLPNQLVNKVVQLNGNADSPLLASIQEAGLNSTSLAIDLTKKGGWQKLVMFLFKQPAYGQFLIADHNYELLRYPFNQIKPKRLYLSDELTMINLDERTVVQKLTTDVLLGDRSTLLELAQVINLSTTETEITNQFFNQIAYRYFADRIVHGRLVTAQDGINSPNSWLRESEND